jgi:excisionase family DNA binding protein
MNKIEPKVVESSGAERLLRKKEVASLLACSIRMVERLVAAGTLTAVKIRGAVRFRLSDVEQIMKGAT